MIHVIETTNYDATRLYCLPVERLESIVTFWGELADAGQIQEWKIDTTEECDRCQV